VGPGFDAALALESAGVTLIGLRADGGVPLWDAEPTARAAYILGNETDTRRSIRRTIDFAKALDTDTAQFSILTPYPGTRVYDDLRGRIFDSDWTHFDSVYGDLLDGKAPARAHIRFRHKADQPDPADAPSRCHHQCRMSFSWCPSYRVLIC